MATRQRKHLKNQQVYRFNKQNNNLHVHHAFLNIYLPFLHNYDEKMANFAVCGERKQATMKFYFGFLNLNGLLEFNFRRVDLHLTK